MSVNHANPSTAADLRGEHFGLEVEFYGLTRERAAKEVARVLGSTARYLGGHYYKWEVRDAQGRKWTVVYDSSISAAPGFYGEECELNTPVLGWEDQPTVAAVLKALAAAGAETDGRYCGIHVHIADAGHTAATLRNLVNLTNANEDLLTLALGITPERRARWCRPVEPRFLRQLNTRKPTTREALAQIWYDQSDWQTRAAIHYDGSRYRLLNLHSLFQGKGVEFRAFNATLDPVETLADVHLCMALNLRAKAVKSSSPDRPETDNPKYTFRCLLLRLGLSGDDFKATRSVLTRRLPGNGAWRR